VRLVVLTLLAFAAGLAAAANQTASPSVGRSAQLGACPRGSVPGIISGRRRCLRSGQRCARRFERQYHRYGFRCRNGRLHADPWIALESRQLHLPQIAPGAACPRSTGRIVNPNFGPAYGDGPVYAAMGTTDGTVSIQNAQQVKGWYAVKVLWITDPHREKTLIRGRQLDGPHRVRFDSDAGVLVPELKIARWVTVSGSDWGHRPSMERVRNAGCYGLQADGKTFSTVIVFQAVG
jgi:hypothetical protein